MIEKLEWDSEFWGHPVWRADYPHVGAVGCTYLLVPVGNTPMIADAVANGYRIVDVRVTLNRVPTYSGFNGYEACESDYGDLCELTRAAIRGTRFFADPNFSNARCIDLYEQCFMRDWHDETGAVLVARDGTKPVGYVTLRPSSATVSIGLLAVERTHREQGIGAILVNSAVDWAATRHFRSIEVATQGSNIPAQRVYQDQGFKTVKNEIWMHRWQ